MTASSTWSRTEAARFDADDRVNPRDSHFAIRVESFDEAVELLRSSGLAITVDRHSVTGFPQLYVVDPDGHVIEVNAAHV